MHRDFFFERYGAFGRDEITYRYYQRSGVNEIAMWANSLKEGALMEMTGLS